MKHSNSPKSCSSCEEKLKDAHPDIAAWFRDKVKAKFQDCHVSWSYRGSDDQEQAFLDGKSELHFPLSPHNKSDDQGNPCSLALDLFELDYNGQARWAWAYFRSIAEVEAEAVFWGGQWPHLGDADHFELRRGSPHS